MTIYYIRPELGSNANTGLSWVAAWSSLYALRLQSISLLPGDLIKIEKAETKVVTGAYALGEGRSTLDSDGRNVSAVYVNAVEAVRRPLGGTSATWTKGPLFTTFATPVSGPTMADAAKINPASIKLCHKVSDAGGVDLSAYRVMFLQIKMSTAYTGTGEQDIPPGVFEIRFCSDTLGETSVLTVPIDVWIKNSTSIYSSYLYTHGGGLPTNVNSVAIWRSATVLTRDAVLWGVTFYRCTLYKGWPSVAPWGKDILVKKQATPFMEATSAQYFGRNAPMDLGWISHQGSADSDSNLTLYPAPNDYPYSAISSTYVASHTIGRCYVVNGIHMVGTTKWNAGAGSQVAAFDLNGSAGGTLASPVVLEGGYDVATDAVTGETLFSGGCDFRLNTHFLDLQGAPHVTVKNITAMYGFAALVANPGTGLYIERAQFARRTNLLGPVEGATSTTDITFKFCNGCNDSSLNMGVMGNLTILSSTFIEGRNGWIPGAGGLECGSLTVDASCLYNHATGTMPILISVREDALITSFLFNGFILPRVVNITQYGRTFTCRNLVPAVARLTGALGVFLTRADSHWGQIRYENCDLSKHPHAYWWKGEGIPTCDEEVHWVNCYTKDSTDYGPSSSLLDSFTSALYKETVYDPVNIRGWTMPRYYALVEINDPLYVNLPNNATYTKHYSGYSIQDAPKEMAASHVRYAYFYPTQQKSTSLAERHAAVRFTGEAAYDPADPNTAYGTWWPWTGVGTQFTGYGDISGVAPRPPNVVKKYGDLLVYLDSYFNSSSIDSYGADGYPVVLPISVAQVYKSSAGPVLNYKLTAGVAYKLRLSVMAGLAFSASATPTPYPITVQGGGNVNSSGLVPQVIAISVLSSGALSPVTQLHIYAFSGLSDTTTWVDLEYDVVPVATGEVSVYLGIVRGGYCALFDGVRIEAV